MNASRPERLRLGVLIGGGGRTLMNLAERIKDGRLHAEIATIIAPCENLKGVQHARAAGMEVHICGRGLEGDERIDACLRQSHVDLVCLAGYMRYFQVDPNWTGRVVNIHPALLPSFGGKGMYGERVHRAVLAHGCKVSGCTAHFVDGTYDNGPIIIQRACAVLETDTPSTLAARVFELECEAYPDAINLIASGRTHVDGRRVRVLPE